MGCLGECLGDVWRVNGSIFVVFWRDLGGKNRGNPEGKSVLKISIFLVFRMVSYIFRFFVVFPRLCYLNREFPINPFLGPPGAQSASPAVANAHVVLAT